MQQGSLFEALPATLRNAVLLARYGCLIHFEHSKYRQKAYSVIIPNLKDWVMFVVLLTVIEQWNRFRLRVVKLRRGFWFVSVVCPLYFVCPLSSLLEVMRVICSPLQ